MPAAFIYECYLCTVCYAFVEITLPLISHWEVLWSETNHAFTWGRASAYIKKKKKKNRGGNGYHSSTAESDSPVPGPQESRDLINSLGDSVAANPAPLHELVFRKPYPHFEDMEMQECDLPMISWQAQWQTKILSRAMLSATSTAFSFKVTLVLMFGLAVPGSHLKLLLMF